MFDGCCQAVIAVAERLIEGRGRPATGDDSWRLSTSRYGQPGSAGSSSTTGNCEKSSSQSRTDEEPFMRGDAVSSPVKTFRQRPGASAGSWTAVSRHQPAKLLPSAQLACPA